MKSVFQNQNGSAMSALLALMPLIVSIVATIVSIFLLVHHVQKSAFICRSRVLQTQNQMLQKMNQLTALNPQAAELRAERIAADQSVRAASAYPPALPAAEAYLALVVERQAVLGGIQRGLIQTGNMQARVAQQATKTEIQNLPGVRLPSVQTSSMQVTPQQDDTPTPDYKPSTTIENDQTMQLSWTVHPLELLPSWIQKWFDEKDFTIQSKCASKPKQQSTSTGGNSQWSAILKRDKP